MYNEITGALIKKTYVMRILSHFNLQSVLWNYIYYIKTKNLLIIEK